MSAAFTPLQRSVLAAMGFERWQRAAPPTANAAVPDVAPATPWDVPDTSALRASLQKALLRLSVDIDVDAVAGDLATLREDIEARRALMGRLLRLRRERAT